MNSDFGDVRVCGFQSPFDFVAISFACFTVMFSAYFNSKVDTHFAGDFLDVDVMNASGSRHFLGDFCHECCYASSTVSNWFCFNCDSRYALGFAPDCSLNNRDDFVNFIKCLDCYRGERAH